MTATCAVHFDLPSIATCTRCGRFCCATCLRGDYLCNECGARAFGELPALSGRGNLARYALWATAACHGLMVVFAFGQLVTGDTAEDSDGLFTIFSGLAALAYVPTYITTIVLVCRWFHLAVRHALARGGQLGVTPGGAVGTWFIPFVNLAKPFQLTRQMYVVAGIAGERVGAWQTMWVLGNISSNLSTRLPGAGGLGVGMVSDLVLIGAAVLCSKVIDELKFE